MRVASSNGTGGRAPTRQLRSPIACVLALVAMLAACSGGDGGDASGSGSELRPLDAALGERISVRAVFAGSELVYAFVADPAHRVVMMKDVPRTPPSGLLYCFGVEDGLFLDGKPLARPVGAPVFALRADGKAVAIELSSDELEELERSLRSVRGPLEDEALATKLRAALTPASDDGE